VNRGWGLGSGAGPALTAEEVAVLRHLATDLPFEDIGEQLWMPREIVRTLALSIYRKMGVFTRAEAVKRGLALGLIRPTDD